jgi:hypothetical protein
MNSLFLCTYGLNFVQKVGLFLKFQNLKSSCGNALVAADSGTIIPDKGSSVPPGNVIVR